MRSAVLLLGGTLGLLLTPSSGALGGSMGLQSARAAARRGSGGGRMASGVRACPYILATAAAPAPGSDLAMGFVSGQVDKFKTYLSEGWQRTKGGFTGLWDNWGIVRSIRSREKQGEKISLTEHLILRKDRQDSTKLLHMLAVYALSPSLLPYYIIFYNKALPSTFSLPGDIEKRMRDVKHQRIAGILQALMDVEKSTINDKDPNAAALGAAHKEVAKASLEAPTWSAAVQCFGAGLVYNATALKPKQQRKPDLSGVPPAVIKGANMAVGGALNFLPAFVLKFQVKSLLHNIHATDEIITKIGATEAIESLGRGDLLELCMERCVGDPSHTDMELRRAAKTWMSRVEALSPLIKEAEGDFQVCPFRARLALLGVQAVESARQLTGAGCLSRALYTGDKTVKLGY